MNIKIPLTKELSNFILRNILPSFFFFFYGLCSFNTWDTYPFICKFSFNKHVSELFPLPSIVLVSVKVFLYLGKKRSDMIKNTEIVYLQTYLRVRNISFLSQHSCPK